MKKRHFLSKLQFLINVENLLIITIKCAIYTTFFIALLMDSFIRDVDNLAFIFIPFQVNFQMKFFSNSQTLGKSLEKHSGNGKGFLPK